MKASKFFKLCIQVGAANEPPESLLDITADSSQESIVKSYRDLLNSMGKMFVKLNAGAE